MRGLLAGIVGKDTSSAGNPTSWFVDWVRGGEPTLSGIAVTPDSAMQFAPVWTCVRIRSEDMGKLPCFLYRRLRNGGKERATDHPTYTLIHDQPNPYQTALEFKQLLQAWCDLRGNGYALKEYDLRGQLIALWPLNPKWITVLRVPDTWELFYQLRIPYMPAETLPAEAILHVRGLTLDGYVGVSPITHHRETIGLGIAAEKYGAAFFGNSAQPSGALKVPGVLKKEAGDVLRADWEQKYRGVDNAKKLAILDGGMEWVQTGMDNVDAQYLEARKFQNHQIYALYRVPPHKAGELSGATHSNIEHQGLEYVADCLMTEMVRWEQALKRDLLTAKDIADGLFFEFLADALLRSDQKTRYEAYAIGRNWGWLSVNDIRERENMNRVPNGDIRLEPLNMIEAGTPRPLPGATPPGATPATQTPGSDPAAPTPDVSGASISADGARHLLALAQILVSRVEAETRDQSRVPAGSPDGGQFAPGGDGGSGGASPGEPPAADGGTFSKQIITDALAFIKDKSAMEVIAAVAGSERGQEAITVAIGSIIAHGFGAAASGFWYQEPGLDHDIATTVHNLAAHAQVTLGRAREMMEATMSGLVAARSAISLKSWGRWVTITLNQAGADESDDPVLDLLVSMHAEFHAWHGRNPLSLDEANITPPPPA